MQVSVTGYWGWGTGVRMSVGGQDSKTIPQRQEACHLRPWTLQAANVPALPPLEPLTFGFKTALTYNAKEAERWLGDSTAAPSLTLRALPDPQGVSLLCTMGSRLQLDAGGTQVSPAISSCPSL